MAEIKYLSETEQQILRRMLTTLEVHGWKPFGVDDGGDEYEPCTTHDEVLGHVDSVEVSTIGFTKGEMKAFVMVVVGNGTDIISDYSIRYKEFEDLMDNFLEDE